MADNSKRELVGLRLTGGQSIIGGVISGAGAFFDPSTGEPRIFSGMIGGTIIENPRGSSEKNPKVQVESYEKEVKPVKVKKSTESVSRDYVSEARNAVKQTTSPESTQVLPSEEEMKKILQRSRKMLEVMRDLRNGCWAVKGGSFGAQTLGRFEPGCQPLRRYKTKQLTIVVFTDGSLVMYDSQKPVNIKELPTTEYSTHREYFEHMLKDCCEFTIEDVIDF